MSNRLTTSRPGPMRIQPGPHGLSETCASLSKPRVVGPRRQLGRGHLRCWQGLLLGSGKADLYDRHAAQSSRASAVLTGCVADLSFGAFAGRLQQQNGGCEQSVAAAGSYLRAIIPRSIARSLGRTSTQCPDLGVGGAIPTGLGLALYWCARRRVCLSLMYSPVWLVSCTETKFW
jgi:hypothetical protein